VGEGEQSHGQIRFGVSQKGSFTLGEREDNGVKYSLGAPVLGEGGILGFQGKGFLRRRIKKGGKIRREQLMVRWTTWSVGQYQEKKEVH